MLRQRNKTTDLPLTSHIPSNMDGSGRSVQMEAPIMKAARNASSYTKYSYMWLFGSIFSILYGWHFATSRYATTYLSCKDDGNCILKIIPPNRKKRLSLTFTKDQLITAQSIQVNIHGEPLDLDSKTYHRSEETYESYYMVLNQYGKDAAEVIQEEQHRKEIEHDLLESVKKEEAELMQKYGSAARTDPALGAYEEEKRTKEEKIVEMKRRLDKEQRYREEIVKDNELLPNLESILPFAIQEADHQYRVIMRRYNVGHKRRRVASLITKIKMYASGQKDTLVIRENRILAWQGILLIVLGVFSGLLSLLLGQFSEPDKNMARKRHTKGRRGSITNTAHARSNMGITRQMSYRSASQSQSQSQYKPKAYGGYNPSKNSYSY